MQLFGSLRTIPVMSTPWLSFAIGDVHEFIISQLVAIIAFPIISLLTKDSKPADEFLKEIFTVMKSDEDVGELTGPPATPDELKKAEKNKLELEYHAEALHENCKSCHKAFNKKYKPKKAPTTCTKCHPKT